MSLETFIRDSDSGNTILSERDKIMLGRYFDPSDIKPEEDLIAYLRRGRYLSEEEQDLLTSELFRNALIFSAKIVELIGVTRDNKRRQIRDFTDGRRFTIEIGKDFEITRIARWTAIKVREIFSWGSTVSVVTWKDPEGNVVAERLGLGKTGCIESFYGLQRIGPSIQKDVRPKTESEYGQQVLDNMFIASESRSLIRGRFKI